MASHDTSWNREDDNQIYRCSVCYQMEVVSYDGWLYHLGTREHQVNLYKSDVLQRWRQNYLIRNRTVEVKQIFGLTSTEMLEYLTTWGEIEDFNYAFRNNGENGKTWNCHCCFRNRETAEAVLAQMFHDIKGKRVTVNMLI